MEGNSLGEGRKREKGNREEKRSVSSAGLLLPPEKESMGKCGNWEKWGCEGKGKLLRPSRLLFPPGGNFPFPFFRHSVCFFALAARGKEAFAKVQNIFSLETEASKNKK